jgi:hypothetical protein
MGTRVTSLCTLKFFGREADFLTVEHRSVDGEMI